LRVVDDVSRAGRLRAVERHVGGAQQALVVVAVLGRERDPDTACDVEGDAGELERDLELLEQAGRGRTDRVLGGVGEHDRELAAAARSTATNGATRKPTRNSDWPAAAATSGARLISAASVPPRNVRSSNTCETKRRPRSRFVHARATPGTTVRTTKYDRPATRN